MISRRWLFLLLCVVGSTIKLHAAYEFLGNAQRCTGTTAGVTVVCENGHALEVTFLKPEMIRVTLHRQGQTEALLDYPLAKTEWPPLQTKSSESDSLYTMRSAALVVEIHKTPCRITIKNLLGQVLCEDEAALGMGWDGNEVRCWKKIVPDEKFLGLGEKTGNINKRGQEWVMWNSDTPAYGWSTDPIYQSIPFFIGIRERQAYGLYFNNSYRTRFNMGASTSRYYSFSAERGHLDYFFFAGPKPADVLEQYTDLTGRAPLPPLWSLGFQQCRYSYFPDKEVLRIANTFREKQIPADVIYLDIHYMDGYRVFTWNKDRFPDPQKMLKQLADLNFRVVTIIDPGVKVDTAFRVCREGLAGNHFVTYPDGQTYIGEVWPGPSYFSDYSRSSTRAWWGGLVGEWLKNGVSGIWNDMNEPAVWGQAFPLETRFDDEGRGTDHKKMHNLYGFLMARATYEGALKAEPNERPFILTRAGFAGEQRYTAVWTGDNIASWDHLELGIRMLQGLSVSGVPFVGTDIGGFIGMPSSELFARWIQVGSLSPLCRAHTEYGTPDKEPWAFGERVEDISRNYISLRYRLLPYFYSLFYEASQTGAPLWRPLCWNDPADNNTWDWANQQEFFVGENLLAAPVTRENQYLKKVYLPRGWWLDWSDETVYEGGQTITVETPLEKMPIFLHEGAIIPLQDVKQHTADAASNRLTLEIYPAIHESGFTLYEDDGRTFDYENGEYRLTQWACQRTGDEVRINQTRPHDRYSIPDRPLQLRIHAVDKAPGFVTLEGKPLEQAAVEKTQSGYQYDSEKRILTIVFPDARAAWRLIVQ